MLSDSQCLGDKLFPQVSLKISPTPSIPSVFRKYLHETFLPPVNVGYFGLIEIKEGITTKVYIGYAKVFGITMVCGHRALGKQVSVFEVGKRFRRGKLTKSR